MKNEVLSFERARRGAAAAPAPDWKAGAAAGRGGPWHCLSLPSADGAGAAAGEDRVACKRMASLSTSKRNPSTYLCTTTVRGQFDSTETKQTGVAKATGVRL